ncbi:hypothetical protein B0H11DRAFT_1919920 [Mycena galericulata]|nr:hypothetical protein B0H11DRAFT_1919920 [Mycena galericulata]
MALGLPSSRQRVRPSNCGRLSAFWARDGDGTAKRRPSTGMGRQWQPCPPDPLLDPPLLVGQGPVLSNFKKQFRARLTSHAYNPSTAVNGQPSPSRQWFSKGSMGRDGMPLTAPVTPVKTGTVGSPKWRSTPVGLVSTPKTGQEGNADKI